MEEENQGKAPANPRRQALDRLRLAALTHLAASVAAGVALERVASSTSQAEAAGRLALTDGPSVFEDIAAIATTNDPRRLKALCKAHSAKAKARTDVVRSLAKAKL